LSCPEGNSVKLQQAILLAEFPEIISNRPQLELIQYSPPWRCKVAKQINRDRKVEIDQPAFVTFSVAIY
jgi:hypothetical protein